MPDDFLPWAARRGFDARRLREDIAAARTRTPERLPTWEEVVERKYGVTNLQEAIRQRDSLRKVFLEAEARGRVLEERIRTVEATSARQRWPWGAHETELLRHLAAAAEHWWAKYDPADRTSAPTNKVVEEWLERRGVSQRNAQFIATVLRADGLPTGPRT